MQRVNDRKAFSTILPSGWLWLCFLCILPIVVGVLIRDFNALMIGFLGFCILIGAYFCGKTNLKKLEMSLEHSSLIFSGKSIDLTIIARNHKKLFSSRWVTVEIVFNQDSRVTEVIDLISEKSEIKVMKRFSFKKRGGVMSNSLKLSSRFPFYFFAFDAYDTIYSAATILPRKIKPVELEAFGDKLEGDSLSEVSFGERGGEFRGIRSWRPGDTVKSIHWQSSSKSLSQGRGLRVKEYDPPGHSAQLVTVIFHSFAIRGEVYRTDRFERAISLLTGTLDYLFTRNIITELNADFLGWNPLTMKNRADYIKILTILSEVKRAPEIFNEQLQAKLNLSAESADQVIVVSDVDPDSYKELLNIADNIMEIDIRQVSYGRNVFSKAS